MPAGVQPVSGRQFRLAVLIDAENISHRLAARVFDLVAPLGAAPIRRIYGDFAGSAASWAEAAARHALEPRHCFTPARGKNGADIALTIDAVELLRDGRVDGFCIVSSDGDFAELARHIRRDGRVAFGLGCANSTQGYRDSCTKFYCLESAPKVTAVAHNAALPKIRKALEACQEREGWYNLCEFGKKAKAEKLVPKNYGSTTLGKLLRETGQFTFKDDGQHFRRVPQLRAVAGGL